MKPDTKFLLPGAWRNTQHKVVTHETLANWVKHMHGNINIENIKKLIQESLKFKL